jgi:hypothetical protein
MSVRVLRANILTLLEGDELLYEQLRVEGVIPSDEQLLAAEHLEVARVVHTLVRELEVNWAGVELVLRLRGELIDARRQVAELLDVLQRERNEPVPRQTLSSNRE